MRRRWYVGFRHPLCEAFASATTPTPSTHGQYNAVMGPFRTQRAADYCVAAGWNNPHTQTVADCERLAKA